jgi:UDP-N-acetylmuramate dehydrogenase
VVASKRVLLYYYSVNRLLEILNKININGSVTINEKMAKHTTFRCGGAAELFVRVQDIEDVKKLKAASITEGFPLFILGGGANILVSDRGIQGVTLSMNGLSNIEKVDDTLEVEAGISVNKLCEYALKNSLSGLEFIYGMPGSAGGAVWMNARCYGDEISNHFLWAEYLDSDGSIKKIYKNDDEWDYKISPFQKKGIIITKVGLKLNRGNYDNIKEEMNKNRGDRRDKGHFNYPCAGSVFKNNRTFGAPSGKIIEDAGLKGEIRGGAQISTFHANIIVNLGTATASDINFLINKVIDVVYKTQGFTLETEVLKVGNWED